MRRAKALGLHALERVRTAGPGLLARLKNHKDLVILLVIFFAFQGNSYLQNAHTQAAQREQGQRAERVLCLAVVKQAALQPPAGNPATNPSRGYSQGEHRTWVEIADALGCRR